MGSVLKLAEFKPVKKQKRKKVKLNKGRKGSIVVRGGKISVDFYYMNQRVRENTGLTNTEENQKRVRLFLDKIHIEIEAGNFVFAEYFPHSKKKNKFSMLEGNEIKVEPCQVTFGEYYNIWIETMKPSFSKSQCQDYEKIVRHYLMPYFEEIPFSYFKPMFIKKFLAHMQSRVNPKGDPLSSKTINNVFIPLRAIVRDAIAEYEFDLVDPFIKLKMPKKQKVKINPLTKEEWSAVHEHMNEWYRPYFKLALCTGLRTSEQIALKWSAIDDNYIHIELSRVPTGEKKELKTASSNRRIEIRGPIRKILEEQKELSKGYDSEYVFLNTFGGLAHRNQLYCIWKQALERAGVEHRRMYETRHTFASWALAAGEQPSWVARILGHSNLMMVYTVYARFIPALFGSDGGKFDNEFS